MTRVAVVGSGFVGRAWAISFARAGYEVALWDQDKEAPGKALAYIERLLPDLEANDLLNGASASEVAARIRVAATLEVGARRSGPRPGEHAGGCRGEARGVRAARRRPRRPTRSWRARPPRFFLRPSPKTSKAARAVSSSIRSIRPISFPPPKSSPRHGRTRLLSSAPAKFLRAAGHAPIVMKREIDGFVMNRLQGALLEEAFRLVEQGYAGVEDVDVGIREGLALRWSFMGPFETIDLNAPAGVRDYADRYQGIYSGIFPSTQWRVDWSGPVMDKVESERRERLAADRLAERQAWRDRRLIALAAHKRWADKNIGD